MDFSKFKPGPSITVRYRCDKCGEEEDYITEMPAGWQHGTLKNSFKRCSGKLIEVSRKERT